MVDTLIIELSFLPSTISDDIACETSREFQSRDFDEADLPLYVQRAHGTQPFDRIFGGVPE